MGSIILEFENLNPKRYNIPVYEPLVFDLFNTPTQVNRVINNTNKKYYVRLFTDEFYIDIDPNANYNLKLSGDGRDEKYSIRVKSKIFTHGIARKTIHGLKFNEMIPKRDETMGEYMVDLYYSNNSRILYDNIDDYSKEELVDSFYIEIDKILQELLQTEQECTNTINDMKEEKSKCEQKTTNLKGKPDLKSSNIWLVILYLIIILIVTKLIYGSIPPLVVNFVIITYMLEMLYGKGFSTVFTYFFYILLPIIIIIIVIKLVFGISSPPNTYNRYTLL